MKTGRKLLSALLLGLLVFAAAGSAMADNEDYTYTVRIYPGNNASCDSGDCIEVTGIPAGTQMTIAYTDTTISLNGQTLTLNDGSKYFIKGVREGGDDALANVTFTVNYDKDFVAAYGMRSTAVQYTLRYVVEGTGEELGSETFIGNIGDKPVNAARHFDGYRPKYNNITGTLKDGENVWELPYKVSDANTTTTTEVIEYVTVPSNNSSGNSGSSSSQTASVETTPAPETAETSEAVSEETAPAEETSETSASGEEAVSEAEEAVSEDAEEAVSEEPEDVLDIDEQTSESSEETAEPASSGSNEGSGSGSGSGTKTGLSTGAKAGIGVGVAAAAAAVIGAGAAKKKNKR